MLELRSERQMKATRDERDLVLDKRRREPSSQVGREKRQRRGVVDAVVRVPVSNAPDDVVPFRKSEAMANVQVIGVELLAEDRRDVSVRAVVIGLDLQIRGRRQSLRPAPENVAALQIDVARGRLRDRAVVKVRLERQELVGPGLPVHAKAALSHPKSIVRVLPVGQNGIPSIEVLPVQAEIGVATKLAAIPRSREPPLHVSGAARDQNPLSFLRALGDDVDDSVDGVGAPHSRPRAADHLDARDVLHERVLRVPEDSRIKRRIKAPTIHQDEQFVRGRAVEASGGNGVLTRVHAGHLDARNVAQRLWEAESSRAVDLLVGDHVNSRRSLGQLLGLLRNGGDLDLE